MICIGQIRGIFVGYGYNVAESYSDFPEPLKLRGKLEITFLRQFYYSYKNLDKS